MSSVDDIHRRLDAARIPLPLDNAGAQAGDLWGGDGRFIGNIDEPLFADVIAAAVNALPALLAVARAAAAVCGETFGPTTDLRGRVAGGPDRMAARRAALAALDQVDFS